MKFGRSAMRSVSHMACLEWTKAWNHAQPREVANPRGIQAVGITRLHDERWEAKGQGGLREFKRIAVASVFVRSEHVMRAYGVGCEWCSSIGFCNGCFWVAIQCEVWTKFKRPCKPYFIFGMNYGPTPVVFAMRNQVRMNVFWVVPI